MRHPAPILLDLVAPVHRSRRTGIALCMLGLAAAAMVGTVFMQTVSERDRLDAQLGAQAKPRHTPSATEQRAAAELDGARRELTVPWVRLLTELESAAVDSASSVAVLQIEPDPVKRVVKITAEARSLGAGLDYLQRLQKSAVLRYPLLESHSYKKDDPQHAVLVKLSAEWRP